MAYAFTLGTLVTRCRQRFAGEGESLLDDPEVKALISEYYGELHALTVEKGARAFEQEADITADGAVSYALPSNHLSTIGVDAVLSGTTGPRRPVWGPIMAQERTRYMGRTGPAFFWAEEGVNLALFPVPQSGTYKHLYVPQPVDYATSPDATSVDLLNIYGLKFLVWGVASVAQHKSSSSQQRAVDEHEKAKAQVEYWACQRALVQPSYRVPDSMPSGSLGFVDPADWRWAP